MPARVFHLILKILSVRLFANYLLVDMLAPIVKEKQISGKTAAELGKYPFQCTLSSRQRLERKSIREWCGRTFGGFLKLYGAKIWLACDRSDGGKRYNGPISWHIMIDVELNESQREVVQLSALRMMTTRKLHYDKDLFYREGINNCNAYLLNHKYVDHMVIGGR